MIADPISDLITRIRNAHMAKHRVTHSPSSTFRKGVLAVLQREGYIRGFEEVQDRPGVASLKIELKYHEGVPAIRTLRRRSKPGCRVYSSVAKLPRVHNGLGVSVLSTPLGVLSDLEAREKNVGGEVLFEVF